MIDLVHITNSITLPYPFIMSTYKLFRIFDKTVIKQNRRNGVKGREVDLKVLSNLSDNASNTNGIGDTITNKPQPPL